MDLGIQGKRALVLAGGGGLGSAIARSLAQEGVEVVIADVNRPAAEAAASMIGQMGGTAHAMEWDLAATASKVDERIAACQALAGGSIDILINNTGGPPPYSALDIPATAWRENFESMVLSVVSITEKLLPAMKRQGWGRIITSASSGVVSPIPNLALSNSLRSALVGWSKTLASEVGAHGITVNVIVPGRIATERITQLDKAKAVRENRPEESVRDESTASIPLRRYGRPEEYANAVTFLASDAASYVTGSILRVDGGLISSI